MRLHLAIILAAIAFSGVRCQLVFCPPGATWNYAFTPVPQWSPNPSLVNETISYVKDSIVGTDTVKVLVHSVYYSTCYNDYGIKFTLIRQKGDTVFFRNERTQHTWQILFNFSSAPGTGWQTNYLKASGGIATYSYTVDSIGYVNINNHNLKRLYLGTSTITERIGRDNAFFFSFFSYASGCDGYYYKDFYCYGDASFGIKQFTDKPCYFSGVDDIAELNGPKKFSLFPNPASNEINLSFDDLSGNKQISITNSLGALVSEVFCTSETDVLKVNLSHFPPGMYLVSIIGDSGTVVSKKFALE
jgi:hypothetical protein